MENCGNYVNVVYVTKECDSFMRYDNRRRIENALSSQYDAAEIIFTSGKELRDKKIFRKLIEKSLKENENTYLYISDEKKYMISGKELEKFIKYLEETHIESVFDTFVHYTKSYNFIGCKKNIA